MIGYTLDAGALIALERGDQRIRALLAEAARRERPVRLPSGALAQAWRDPVRQVALTRLCRSAGVQHVRLDDTAAKATGLLCRAARTVDVVDASVAVCALTHEDLVVTGDIDDMSRLVPADRLVAV